jgi:hypothetical protein
LGARREALSKTIERDAYSGEQFLKYVPPEPLPLSPEVKLNPVGNGEFEVVGNGLVLSPLCDVRQLTLPDTIRQIVFKEQ